MFGFTGQNANIWYEYLNRHSEYKVTYITTRKLPQTISVNKNIKIKELLHYTESKYLNKIIYVINKIMIRCVLFNQDYDSFYLQGLYNWSMATEAFFYVKAKKKTIVIWNDSNHRKLCSQKNDPSAIMMIDVLKSADRVLTTWTATEKAIQESFSFLKGKTDTKPWGFSSKVATAVCNKREESIDSPKQEPVYIFWPRSMHPNIRHDVLLDALALISTDIELDIFWAIGVVEDKHSLDRIFEKVAALSNNVSIEIEHSKFLSLDEIIPHYHKSSIMINLADTDQLSQCIYEAMAFKNYLIMSDIVTYRAMEKVGFQVAFTRNDPVMVAQSIEMVVASLLDNRLKKAICENQEKVLDYYDLERNMTDIFEGV